MGWINEMDKQTDKTVAEWLCEALGAMGGEIPFVPEIWRDGAASVQLTGGGERVRSYVDGTAVVGVPFEIRVRCAGHTIGDRLDVLAFYTAIAAHIRVATVDGCRDGRIECVATASRAAVYDSGEEEYRAAYRLLYTETI